MEEIKAEHLQSHILCEKWDFLAFSVFTQYNYYISAVCGHALSVCSANIILREKINVQVHQCVMSPARLPPPIMLVGLTLYHLNSAGFFY